MGFDVTLLGAAGAGLLSFASPCILPIVPPYLCFLAGVSLEELTDSQGGEASARRRVVLAALAFALGFATVFVAMGATASTVGQTIAQYFDVLRWIAGGVILLLGLHFLGVLRIPLLYRQARVEVNRKPATLAGAYLVGLAFAFGWTPCVGPVLAAILFTAGAQETAAQGAMLLGAYALGIGAPFVLAAAFAGPFMGLMRKFRRHMGLVEKGMGAALVVTGLLFVTNSITVISGWMIGFVPVAG
ncbi:cytochrome c biogenesis CcdA family protein [Rubrimonas cliftonensis]|uniref:Cytochrome c-type biogenesis protein n=1 Tax=Rubrimonas cliftonensis TaxID=89524 RepID=A0A1H4DH23_9RHOB|nr:cytochrome c biogenesis protein CcdA [Rubrimonas cliftonensis]SEA71730.1 cytochrome c-type biogenesis protein [Rubrimonas cliftonensis]